MPMTPKQMVKLLKRNGFVEVRQVGSHERFKNPQTGAVTTVPFHNRQLAIGTEKKILKEAGLNR